MESLAGIEDRKAAVESLEAVNEVVVTPPGGRFTKPFEA